MVRHRRDYFSNNKRRDIMTKRCILDVDGTLWDFHSVLHEILHDLYGSPKNVVPTTWLWYTEWMTDEQFFHGVSLAHDEQWNHDAFSGAEQLINELHEQNYEIIVASHRDLKRGRAYDLAIWLVSKVSDKWTSIYAGPSKHFLIKPNDLVIDDSPKT